MKIRFFQVVWVLNALLLIGVFLLGAVSAVLRSVDGGAFAGGGLVLGISVLLVIYIVLGSFRFPRGK